MGWLWILFRIFLAGLIMQERIMRLIVADQCEANGILNKINKPDLIIRYITPSSASALLLRVSQTQLSICSASKRLRRLVY